MGDLRTGSSLKKTLAEAITGLTRDYVVNEGDGAFYGESWTSIWPIPSAMPGSAAPFSSICSCRRLSAGYTGADGEKHRRS